MDEHQLKGLVGEMKGGRLSRRDFVRHLAALGLSGPMAGMILADNGVAMAAEVRATYKPTEAGGGGPLKLLFWQAPTLINPHFAIGTKDQEACRIFYEPLAAWDGDANLLPVLAAVIPSKENGMVGADGRSVTWRIKPNVKWHDGMPLTADDLVFTWAYAKDPATAATSISSYSNMSVEKVDDLTIHIAFDKPTPLWANPFVGTFGMVMPKHVFAGYAGAKSREAPANLAPVGTGPYTFVDFRPGDILRGRAQHELPPAQPALLRHDRGEGRRRRRLGRPRGAADRRVRLRLEHADRGRDPQAARGRRSRPHRGDLRRQPRTPAAERHRSPTRRSTARSPRSRPSIRPSPTLPCWRR